MISVTRPFLGDEELRHLGDVLKSGWLGLGKQVEQFEKEIARIVQARNVIAVNSGTSALHIALDAYGVTKGDEVLVPSLTFVATVQAVLMTGATPVFCDVNEATLNIDVADVRRKISSRTKGVIPVHYSGIPCDMDEIETLCEANGIHIVQDAAHAFGSSYKGRKIGSFAGATCFSFDPIKIITCGDGGAVAVESDEIAEIIRRKRILGIERETGQRYSHQRSWFYEVNSSGFRYHLNNIGAAIGLEQLKRLESFLISRRATAQRYDSELSRVPEITVIKKNLDTSSPFNYIIRVPKREELIIHLKGCGVETGVHYIPNHTQPFFNCGDKLPITERVAEELLTLPLSSLMPEADVSHVIESVKKFYQQT